MQKELYQSNGFNVFPCFDCDLPGYLVLVARGEKATLAELSSETQSELGKMLARLDGALRTICGAEHVYVLRFSESISAVHFHIFPRTQKLAEQWLADLGRCDEIDGPELFVWARNLYRIDQHQHLSAETLRMAERIKRFLGNDDGETTHL